jgi:hypothetical protein
MFEPDSPESNIHVIVIPRITGIPIIFNSGMGVPSVFGEVTPLKVIRPSNMLSDRGIKDAILLYNTGLGIDRNLCLA